MGATSSGAAAPVNDGLPPKGDATTSRAQAAAPLNPKEYPDGSVAAQLFAEPYGFDFFQAVRLLERLAPARRPVGRVSTPRTEVVRFRAHMSLSFPPSSVYDLALPASPDNPPEMTVTFMGLTGPSGILPRHYTEILLRQAYAGPSSERYTLRDWFDMFNHRFIALHYRAWEKYRFYLAYERGEGVGREPDAFTLCLYSLIGMAPPPLRNRLQVGVWEQLDEEWQERSLARVLDLALLHYSGYLSHKPRCAAGLEAMLQDYFRFAVKLQQFRGQWFRLEPTSQSRTGGGGDANNELGVNLVAGDRVWDVQSKFRIRLGPLSYQEFTELLPDRAPRPERKTFFILCHLARLYVGPEFDFDVQVSLRASEVPACQLAESESFTPRLGWNTWIASQPFIKDAEEAVFEAEEVRWLNEPPAGRRAG